MEKPLARTSNRSGVLANGCELAIVVYYGWSIIRQQQGPAILNSNAEPITLLCTKPHMPRVSDDPVERPRLYRRLNRGLRRKLTLVSAPAGFGKATLVAAWLQTHDRAAAWLSLSENESDLSLFLHYVIGSLRTIFSDACHHTLTLLDAVDAPPLDFVVTTFINEVADRTEPVCLVLDDYHLIHDNRVHQFVASLIDHMPVQRH